MSREKSDVNWVMCLSREWLSFEFSGSMWFSCCVCYLSACIVRRNCHFLIFLWRFVTTHMALWKDFCFTCSHPWKPSKEVALASYWITTHRTFCLNSKQKIECPWFCWCCYCRCLANLCKGRKVINAFVLKMRRDEQHRKKWLFHISYFHNHKGNQFLLNAAAKINQGHCHCPLFYAPAAQDS